MLILKKYNILVAGEGPTQRLDDSTITAEAKYPINFTSFILCLHCMPIFVLGLFNVM